MSTEAPGFLGRAWRAIWYGGQLVAIALIVLVVGSATYLWGGKECAQKFLDGFAD